MTTAYAFNIVALSDTGLMREHNEDSIALDAEVRLAVLADGMGGYNAGEVASAMTTAALIDALRAFLAGGGEYAAPDIEAAMRDEIMRANRIVFEAAQRDQACEGMGTTVVAALCHGSSITVGHVGDSRMYRLRDGVLEAITRDHSLLQEQMDAGLITAEEAQYSHNRNLITRAIGVMPDVEPEVHSYAVQDGDTYLMCTDGLYGLVEHEDMQASLMALRGNLDLCAQQLVQMANDHGGSDNISLILMRIGEEPSIELDDIFSLE